MRVAGCGLDDQTVSESVTMFLLCVHKEKSVHFWGAELSDHWGNVSSFDAAERYI